MSLGATDIAAMLADLATMDGTVTVVFAPDGDVSPDLATVQVAALLERSASGEASPIDLDAYDGTIRFLLAAGAAVAGTLPTLDVKLQHCASVDGDYEDVASGAFARVTTIAGVQALAFEGSDLARFVKLVWAIGGTDSPAFPFALAIEATPIVDGTVYTTHGLRDRDAIELFGGEMPGVQATDDAVHIQTGALPGLAVGLAVTIDGEARVVHAMQPYGDGAMCRILPRTP